MTERETTNKLIRLLTLLDGFGTRRITGNHGRVYFAHKGAIYATGHDFTKRDYVISSDGYRRLPRPMVANAPDGFDEIYKVEARQFFDGSVSHVGTQYADDAPLDYVLSVYEAAYAIRPWWRKAYIIIRAILAGGI